jgi:GNAT superfamily N-acetyltransferase
MAGLNAAARTLIATKNVPEALEAELAGALVLVAVDEAGLVGMGALQGHELVRVYVRPEAQRKGVGRTIVSALQAEARKRGLGTLTVHASPSSVPFYRSIGYQPEERVTSRSGEAEFTHVRMTKPLP